MDMISIRRKLMAKMQSGGIDTSPRIAEYGVNWNRSFGGKSENAGWCITDWYETLNMPVGGISINGYVGHDNTTISFQYIFSDGSSDWYYFGGTNPRRLPSTSSKSLKSITFSIEIAERNNAYAYIEQTGQILFAGRNTPYYGYTNIHDMPTGT